MTPAILRSVLLIASVMGLGVVLNIFWGQPPGLVDRQAATRLAKPPAPKPVAAKQATVRSVTANRQAEAVRRELQTRGYLPAQAREPSEVALSAAILAFEFDHNLTLTATPSDALLKALVFPLAPAAGEQHTRGETQKAKSLISEVQRALKHLGYGKAGSAAMLDAATRAAIRKFERARGLEVSGRVSAPLIARLGPAFDATRVAGTRTAAKSAL